MQAELKMSGITNVGMHNLSPGMVTTDLLMSGQYFSHRKPAVQDKLYTPTCHPDISTQHIQSPSNSHKPHESVASE